MHTHCARAEVVIVIRAAEEMEVRTLCLSCVCMQLQLHTHPQHNDVLGPLTLTGWGLLQERFEQEAKKQNVQAEGIRVFRTPDADIAQLAR